jgi:very-short-patch-repair endonuclease
MNLYILAGIVIALVIVLTVLKAVVERTEEHEKPKYRYTRKQFFLTRAEHEFYDALIAAVGEKYHVFAQVHLPTILDNKVKGQDWRAALAHINRKSVDFVLCDKAYISPKLAIELDDKSHERPDRQERDKEVERILADAGVPLLRIENKGRFDPAELGQRINEHEQRNQTTPPDRQ